MNTSCPTCGAIYNVAAKDIGRKLKCKKCNTALKVTDAGLEVDGGTGTAPPADSKAAPVPVAAEMDDEGDEPVVKKKKGKYERGAGVNPLAALNAIGGLPTILFGFGVFLVILFTSLPIIGSAGTARDNAYKTTLTLDRDAEYKEKEPKKKQKDWTEDDMKKYGEEKEKIDDKYKKLFDDADRDAKRTENRNIRLAWFEQYGLMFGFMFVSFGCIGYLRTEQPLVMKIVAGVVLAFMMMIMFMKFGGCSGKM